ncbi:hypothetical protein MPH_00124 [Macrophomina phaseolina MS6]|uniref:Uncharacterized protein n=1 Tax=Macrophomina phaseolina (strain MS6) TaxID=1126212 RepID=K2RJ44_MACPH|nr:hypothetical protein MPH_00124 [Macrophomina phaseolina MS6]
MVPPLIMPGSSVADTLSPLQIWPQTIAFSPLRRALDDARTTRWPATVTTTFLSPRSRQPTLSTTTQLTEVAPFPTHSLSQVQVWHCQRTLQIPASPDAEDQLIAHNETVLILDKFNFSDPHDGTLPADALVTLWATTNAGLAYPSATTSDFATQSFFISNSCMSTRSIAAA